MAVATVLYVGTLGLSIVLAAVLAVVTFRNRSETTMRWFTAILGCLMLWSTGQIAESLAPGYDVALAGNLTKYLGILGATCFFFVFALEYTDNEGYVTPRTLALLAAYPVGSVLAIATNPLHGLFWTSTDFEPGAIASFENPAGPLFWVYVVIGYGLFVVGSVLLARLYYRSRSLYRGQIAAVLAGVLVPMVTNALYLSGVVEYDLTPAAFVVTGVAVLSAVRWFEFAELTPVARNTVVDTMQAGVFVFDDEDRVTDVNPAGREMVGGGDLVGRPAREVLGELPGLYERYDDLEGGIEEVTVDAGDRAKRYRVEVTPLSDAPESRGRVVVVRDVTDRHERERELRRQNEQLEQFASLVSHDIRNPLSVASGYVDLLEERVEDPELAEYVENVARSHDRMGRIVEDVLTMARQGQTIDETEPVDLGLLVRQAWSNVETGEATLENDLDATVEGDPERLLHVFENLFRNSVEHGSTDSRPKADDSVEHGSTGNRTSGKSDDSVEHGGGGVAVRVGPLPGTGDGDGIGSGFFVEDDGPGIPEKRREAVFEAGHTTNEDGTGLGLAIVDQFVEAHGWSVGATESEDGGARFEVTGIPGVEASPEPPAPEVSD